MDICWLNGDLLVGPVRNPGAWYHIITCGQPTAHTLGFTPFLNSKDLEGEQQGQPGRDPAISFIAGSRGLETVA